MMFFYHFSFCLTLIVIVLPLCGAQTPSFGNCPDITPMRKFDVSRYIGLWYEVRKVFFFQGQTIQNRETCETRLFFIVSIYLHFGG